jgi:hypothetical protein
METQPVNPNISSQPMSSRGNSREDSRRPRSDRNLAGLIVIIVGGFFLARELDVDLPRWLFSWPMLIIAIGLFVGAKHSFRDSKWLIPVAIGTFFLFTNHFARDYQFGRFFWPILVIVIGFVILFKRRGNWQTPGQGGTSFDSKEEVLDSVTIFGGVKKNIISKTFRGGEAVTVFGGTELNFIQSDMENPVVLELTQVFGGTKLIVPAHWKIQTDEMVTIFGGLNDKRPLPSQPSPDQRTLVIKGTCVFGGIDIKSY